MPETTVPFMMMRLPLIISGLLYYGVAWLVYWLFATVIGFDDPEALPREFVVVLVALSIGLGTAAIGFACIVHLKSKPIYLIAVIITVLYLPSAYIFLGIPMLLFLLRKDTRDYYGIDI